MNFLEKFLATIVKIGQVAVGIEPTIVQALPAGGTAATVANTLTDDLTTLGQLVQNGLAVVTALGSNPTPQAAINALVPVISQSLLQSELLSGKKVKDAAGFAAGASSLAAGISQVLSSVE